MNDQEGPSMTGIRGELLLNEPMSKHTSWRVGGVAERFFKPADLNDLITFISCIDADESLLWIGLGSNLLVRDGGIRGTVILTSGLLKELSLLNSDVVRAEAGVACAKVAKFCARNELVGAEFLAGIPGTMGGALAMNAGAFGGETWELIHSVETLDRQGNRHTRSKDEFKIAYRHVEGPKDEWFIAAHIRLSAGNGAESQQKIKEFLAKRGATQPTQLPSCGSVFKNPPGDHAARLIESVGLKGKRCGNAMVSDKHANFIVNTGNATAAEIESLILEVQQAVELAHNIKLLPEVHIVGEKKHA